MFAAFSGWMRVRGPKLDGILMDPTFVPLCFDHGPGLDSSFVLENGMLSFFKANEELLRLMLIVLVRCNVGHHHYPVVFN